MGYNRFYKSSPVEFEFEETPLQPLIASMEAKQKRFDLGYELADDISNKYIQALPQDQATANALTQKWQSAIDEAVAGADGDYASAYKNLRKLARDVNKAFAPGGEAAAMQLNYKNVYDAREEEKKRLAKGEITANQMTNWWNHTLSGYSGIGSKDPVTGGYNTLTPDPIAQYVDAYDLGLEVVKELEPMMQDAEWDEIQGEWIVTNQQGIKQLASERITQAVRDRLATNPQYKNFLQQSYAHRGYDVTPDLINATIMDQADKFAPYAYEQITSKYGLKANQVALTHLKERNKAARFNNFMSEVVAPRTKEGYIESTPNTMGRPMTAKEALGAVTMTGLPGTIGIPSITSLLGSPSKEDLMGAINSGKFKERGGNELLLKTILNDPANKDKSAEEVMEIYSTNVSRMQTKVPSLMVLPEDASRDLEQKFLWDSEIANTDVRVKERGDVNFTTMSGRDFLKKYGDVLYADEDPSKGFRKDLGFRNMNRLTGELQLNHPELEVWIDDHDYSRHLKPVQTLMEGYYNGNGEPTQPVTFNEGFIDPYNTEIVMVPDASGRMVPTRVPKSLDNVPIRGVPKAAGKDGVYDIDMDFEYLDIDPITQSKKWVPFPSTFDPRTGEEYKVGVNDFLIAKENNPNNGYLRYYANKQTSTKGVERTTFDNQQFISGGMGGGYSPEQLMMMQQFMEGGDDN